MAPRAFVVPQDLGRPVIANLLRAYRLGVRAHNNSWEAGGPGNSYGDRSRDLDRFCYTHPDLVVVFASGNDESDFLPPPGDGVLDALSLREEQLAKNILCVGATENVRNDAGFAQNYRTVLGNIRYANAAFNVSAGGPNTAFTMSDNADEVALFSNRGQVFGPSGPVGRMRPDLVAPGTNIVSANSSVAVAPTGNQAPPATVPATLYRTLSGTSMAAPHVTGAALLARQYYRTVHSRLGNPRLLGVPATFTSPPSVSPHADGAALIWVDGGRVLGTRAVAGRLVTLEITPVELATGNGDTPAPRAARDGDATFLVYQNGTKGVVLAKLRRDLSLDPAFGTGGRVSVSTAAATSADRPPGLAVAGPAVGVLWAEDGDGAARFVALDKRTGAVTTAAKALGPASQLSTHGALLHDGTDFVAVWRESAAGQQAFHIQRLDGTSAAVTLLQGVALTEPHLAFDAVAGHYLLTWCDDGHPMLRVLDRTFTAIGTDVDPVSLPAGTRARHPLVAPHPVAGALLAWEADTEAPGRFDVYVSMLGAHDLMASAVLKVSDTPLPTEGFAASAGPDGSAVVSWQSTDEANSDARGVYAVTLTAGGAFWSTEDPATPMLHSGQFIGQTVAELTTTAAGLGAVWAGGPRYVLRAVNGQAELVRTNADGVPSPAAVLAGTSGAGGCALWWTGSRLIVATSPDAGGGPTLNCLDAGGAPVTGVAPRTLPGGIGPGTALGHVPGPGAHGSRVLAAFPAGTVAPRELRLAVLTEDLQDSAAGVHTLVPDVGTGHTITTARHGWFAYAAEENLALAAWTDHTATATTARLARSRRNAATGAFSRLPALALTTVAGQSDNAALAPRPSGITQASAARTEFLAAFQFRATQADPWEIRVSRLDHDGAPVTTPPGRRDVRVIFPAAPGWAAGLNAIEPQLACTHVDEPLANPGLTATPAQVFSLWSPGFGLAFVGQPVAGGNRTLYFTVLDENGARVSVPGPLTPGGASGVVSPPVLSPAAIVPISAADADVVDYHLVWTGRSFWLSWLEESGGIRRHRQTFVTRTGSRNAYDAPSAALLRATLLSGTANPAGATLPSVTEGYGWGRLDLRQSLAPPAPVTFHAREDVVGPGGALDYEFTLPANTSLLRVTLAWDDPPGAAVRRALTLHVIPPGAAGQEHRGNVWNGTTSALVPATAPLGPVTVNVAQVILNNPRPGRYRVLVRAAAFGVVPELRLPAQPVALVFLGSGAPIPFTGFANVNVAGPLV